MSSKKISSTPADARHGKKTSLPIFILSAILLVILVVSFVFAPAIVPAQQGLGQGIVFGRYGNQEIAYRPGNFFARQLDSSIQEATSQGYDINSPFIAYTLWLRAFRAASQYAVLMDKAEHAGIDIGEDQIMEAVRESGYFSRNGVFSATDFNNTSHERRQSILNEMHSGLLIGTYQLQLTQDINRSKAAISLLSQPAVQQRNFRMAIFNFDLYPAEKVREFAAENAQLFQEIDVKRILIQGKKQEAIKLYSALANGEKDFPIVFLENSREEFANENISAQEGNLGTRFYYQLQESLAPQEDLDKIFSLHQDQFSPPMRYKTENSKNEVYAIYQVTKTKSDLNLNSNDAVQDVLTYLISTRKNLISDYFIGLASLIDPANFSSSITSPGRFAQSDYFGMVYHLKPDNLSRQDDMYYPYNNEIQKFLAAFGQQYQDIAASALKSKEFFLQAFKLQPNEVSAPIILNNGVIVLQLINTQTPEPSSATTSSLDFLLSYFLSQYSMSSMIDQALESPRYKDNFIKAYAKCIEPYIQQQEAPSQPPPSIGLPQNAPAAPSLHLPTDSAGATP